MKETRSQPKEQLFEQHYPYVLHLAKVTLKRYQLNYDILPDLIQEGSIGLLKAIENFDEGRGIKLTSFAMKRILGRMLRFLKKRKYIKCPSKIEKKIHNFEWWYKKIKASLAQEFGREPTKEEISKRIGLDISTMENLICEYNQMQMPASLDGPTVSHENGMEHRIIDTFCDRVYLPPGQVYLNKLKKEKLYNAIDTLPPLHKQVLSMLYGLNEEEASIREISRKLNISRYQVEQIEYVAMANLHNELKQVY